MANPPDLLAQALAHHQEGRLAEAEALYRKLLDRQPNHPDALHLLGVAALGAGRHAEAVDWISRAIRVQGNSAAVHNNLGEAYRAMGNHELAIAAYQQALRLRPDFAAAHNNLGTIFQSEQRTKEAIACFDRAIAARPEYANAHYNRARAWLSEGNFLDGWREYEWRWRREEFRRLPLPQPEWDGSPLAGRRLLIRAEQGLGDTLQFIRYLPLLQSQGHSAMAEVQPELVPLLAQSGIGPLVARGAPLPQFDVHASLLSLPRLLGTTLETIPAGDAYLSVDEELVRTWRANLERIAGLRVGICWQGSPQYVHDNVRSIALARFAPLARVPGVRLVCLQKGFGLEQLASLADPFEIVDLRPDYDHQDGAFLNAAATICNLDLVITSDTAMAHLAGALGARVWVLLSTSADWRWLQQREDCPWYPTMRLFRQTERGDWPGLFERVAEALSGEAAEAAKQPRR